MRRMCKQKNVEEGEEEMVHDGAWTVYTDLGELGEFAAWLILRGNGQVALRNVLQKDRIHVTLGRRYITVNHYFPSFWMDWRLECDAR